MIVRSRSSKAITNTFFFIRRYTASVNGREYKVPSKERPVIGICLDGSKQAYVEEACKAGVMPFWQRTLEHATPEMQPQGHHGLVTGVMPAFTNPNNVAIITGTTPDVNGICGNYFYDEESDEEVMMNNPKFLRCETILSKLADKGANVLVVTAKTKLLNLLSNGLDPKNCLAISIEELSTLPKDSSSSVALANHNLTHITDVVGRKPPTIYDPDISVYCLDICAEILKNASQNPSAFSPNLIYLSTTDYVQHKYRPGTEEANHFYSGIDQGLQKLSDHGAVVGLTADHGMSPKIQSDGTPNVVFLENILDEIDVSGRVILPITDPYVVHHGALGGYATVHIDKQEDVPKTLEKLRSSPGVYSAMGKEDACREFNLPDDRVGDIIVMSDKYTALGRSPDFHDLSQVQGLRTHGGLDDITVPMFFSKKLNREYYKKLTTGNARNFDLFEFLCNGMESDGLEQVQ